VKAWHMIDSARAHSCGVYYVPSNGPRSIYGELVKSMCVVVAILCQDIGC
jgi:hypothetical protein